MVSGDDGHVKVVGQSSGTEPTLDVRTMGQEKPQSKVGMLCGELQHSTLAVARSLPVRHEYTDSNLLFHRFKYTKSD